MKTKPQIKRIMVHDKIQSENGDQARRLSKHNYMNASKETELIESKQLYTYKPFIFGGAWYDVIE